MKKILSVILIAIGAMNANAQTNETATEAVKNMGVGWNLGNTLDANGAKVSDPDNSAYWGVKDWNRKPTGDRHVHLLPS